MAVDKQECKTVGCIPDWLSGHLYRIGPGLFDLTKQSVNHWFDGMGLLHHFNIVNGTVMYQSRFLQSDSYVSAITNGRLSYREFATDPCCSLFKSFFSKFTTNANVNISKINNQLVGLTETPQPIIFDKETLETNGLFTFDDQYTCNLSTAHPHYHPIKKSSINLAVRMGLNTVYEFYEIKDNERHILSSIPIKRPSYQHSFGLTKNYLILIDSPFKVTPLSILIGNKPYIEHFQWEDVPTRFHVIDLNCGRKKCTIETDGFFMFHQVNAFEVDDTIVFDAVIFNDESVVKSLYLKNLRLNDPVLPSGHLTRFTLNLTQQSCISRERLSQRSVELPRINYASVNTKRYQYAYALSINNSAFFNAITKINVESKKEITYEKEDCIPSEPVFIQNPNDLSEDGVLLSVLFNIQLNQTELHCIDAKTFDTIFISSIPGLTGYTFHGQFYNEGTFNDY